MEVPEVVVMPDSLSVPWPLRHGSDLAAARHCWTSQQWHSMPSPFAYLGCTQVFLNTSFLRLREPQQNRRLRRLVVLATRPFSLLFRSGPRAPFSLGTGDPFGKRLAGIRPTRDVATRLQQHAPGAAHHRQAVLLRSGHGHRPSAQEQLRGDHRCFRLAMDQSQRPAHEGHLLQRPLVGPEESFVFPSQAIEQSGRLQRTTAGNPRRS